MNLDLTEDQGILRDTTRRFLEREAPISVVRELEASDDGFDRGWWRRAAELGWASMFVPEQHGGGSMTGRPASDAAIIAEEIGRTVAPGPFLPVNVVAAGLAADGSEQQQAEHLAQLVAGEVIATWAFAEPAGIWNEKGIGLTAELRGGSIELDGTKSFVEAAGAADVFLVTARTGRGLTQLLVPAATEGLTVRSTRCIDLVRRLGELRFDAVRVPLSAVVGEVGEAGPTVERQLQLALALQVAELNGLAERTYEYTLEYAQDRYAFGRPIASFQALKHRIADMQVWLQFSMAAADATVARIDDGDAVGAARQVSVAKAYVGRRAVDVIHDCVQINGGIGLTWEHDIHVYLRRALVDRELYGSPEQHKERLATLLEL